MKKTIKTIIEISLDSVSEVLEYEAEIIKIFKDGKYFKYGRNGSIMAINEFCLRYHVILSDTITYDDIIRGIWWM